jgi:hypothetical protein
MKSDKLSLAISSVVALASSAFTNDTESAQSNPKLPVRSKQIVKSKNSDSYVLTAKITQ